MAEDDLTNNRPRTACVDVVVVVVVVVVVAFSSRARILGECSKIHFPPAAFFFFFEVEISSRTLIPLFGQDQSTVGQRAETTVAECSLTSCV